MQFAYITRRTILFQVSITCPTYNFVNRNRSDRADKNACFKYVGVIGTSGRMKTQSLFCETLQTNKKRLIKFN